MPDQDLAGQWTRWAEGTDCPFDAPRPASNDHWDFVAALTVSSLYLLRNQLYRGHCVLLFDPRHVVRVTQLAPEEWSGFCADLYVAEKAIMNVLSPDHMNLEMLGNVMPHLHWHIVPRYRDDPRWGGPVWTTTVEEMAVVRLDTGERSELIQELRRALGSET